MPRPERKVIYSNVLKGLNTLQKTRDNEGLDTFIRCYNAMPQGGSLVKFRPWYWESGKDSTGTVTPGKGKGIYYIPPNTTTGVSSDWLLLIADKEIDRVTIDDWNVDGTFDFGTVTAIQTLAGSPNNLDEYTFKRFLDSSSNDLLFFQNGSSNYNIHYINLTTLAYGHLADAFLAGTSALEVNESVMFAGVGNELYYSSPNDGLTWNAINKLIIPKEAGNIVDLYALNEILVIFCQYRIYTLKGNSTSTFDLKQLSKVGVGYTGTKVDGDVNECYYVDNNFIFHKITENPHFYGISTTQNISDNILSDTEMDFNFYASGVSDFNAMDTAVCRISMSGNLVYFFMFPKSNDSNVYATFIYNRVNKTFFKSYVYYDPTSYPDCKAFEFPDKGAVTRNEQSVKYSNTLFGFADNGKGMYYISQVPEQTGITKASGTNYNPFSFETPRLKLGSDNLKVLLKIYLDISTFGTAGNPEMYITIYDETETLITTLTKTITVNDTKWISLPRQVESRAFYIKIGTDYTGGFRLNRWGIDFIDKGVLAHR